MSLIENNIAFPTKVGKIMGLPLILLCPYLIEIFLEKFDLFTSIWIAAAVWTPFMILSFIYVYFWIKHDENNSDIQKWLKLLEEQNQISRQRNEIESTKEYVNWRR